MTSGKLCLIVLAFIVGVKAYSQTISSPYSSNGIGEIAFQGLPQNYAMGEVGIGMPSPWHINLQNPSLLTYNTLSSFEVGIEGDFRKFRTTTETSSQNGIGLRYLALSFPVVEKARWVTSFAMLPLSSANYHTVAYGEVDENYASKTDYYGEGGLSQLVWANGFRLFKTLAIGVKASYVFGSINDETNIRLGIDSLIRENGFISGYVISYQEQSSYSDFNFSVGASYRFKLSENKCVNVGGVYQVSNKLKGQKDIFYERQLSGRTIGGSEQIIAVDEPIEFQFPVTYGVGVSYEELNKYKIGLDIRRQHWGETSTLEAGEVYQNSTSLSIGGSYTPNYQSVTSYLARTIYRAGFNFKQSPYLLNNTKINDFGINFGASFPVGGASSLETAFKIGVRGTTKNSLIRENYFQFVLGATINDRWFIQRRYD